MNEIELFTAALAITDPAQRAAWLDAQCAGDHALRQRLEHLLAADAAAGNPLDDNPLHDPGLTLPVPVPPSATAAPFARSRRNRRDPRRRQVQALAADRRRGHGQRLDGRADRTGQTQGRRQADPGRARQLDDDPRPLRGRAAGDRPHGSPAHRQAARRRHHRGRLAVLRDGAGEGHPAQSVLRPAQTRRSRTAGVVYADMLGSTARPSEGHHPPRPEADQYPGRVARRQARAAVIDFGLAKATSGMQLSEHTLFTGFDT